MKQLLLLVTILALAFSETLIINQCSQQAVDNGLAFLKTELYESLSLDFTRCNPDITINVKYLGNYLQSNTNTLKDFSFKAQRIEFSYASDLFRGIERQVLLESFYTELIACSKISIPSFNGVDYQKGLKQFTMIYDNMNVANNDFLYLLKNLPKSLESLTISASQQQGFQISSRPLNSYFDLGCYKIQDLVNLNNLSLRFSGNGLQKLAITSFNQCFLKSLKTIEIDFSNNELSFGANEIGSSFVINSEATQVKYIFDYNPLVSISPIVNSLQDAKSVTNVYISLKNVTNVNFNDINTIAYQIQKSAENLSIDYNIRNVYENSLQFNVKDILLNKKRIYLTQKNANKAEKDMFVYCQQEDSLCTDCSDTCTSCLFNYKGPDCKADCKEGFYIQNQNNNDQDNFNYCLVCQQGCQSCSSSTFCQTCLPTFELSFHECVCKQGQFSSILDNKLQCSICQKSCLQCVSKSQCTNCASGYYLNYGSCIQCNIYACDRCSDATYCTRCHSLYIQINGKCKPQCKNNCAVCVDHNECQKCNNYYYLAKHNQCYSYEIYGQKETATILVAIFGTLITLALLFASCRIYKNNKVIDIKFKDRLNKILLDIE